MEDYWKKLFILNFVFILTTCTIIPAKESRCKSGWRSPSIGQQGACSHHGGVDHSWGFRGWINFGGILFVWIGIPAIINFRLATRDKKNSNKTTDRNERNIEHLRSLLQSRIISWESLKKNTLCPECGKTTYVRGIHAPADFGAIDLVCGNVRECKYSIRLEDRFKPTDTALNNLDDHQVNANMLLKNHEIQIIELARGKCASIPNIRDISENAKLVRLDETGYGYFLTLSHPSFPVERTVISEHPVVGTADGIEFGFVAFVENNELTLECFSSTAEPLLFNIRSMPISIQHK